MLSGGVVVVCVCVFVSCCGVGFMGGRGRLRALWMWRGRWGRSWYSPKGKGLLFSVILRPQIGPESTSLLTMMGTVAVLNVLERRFGVKLYVKWPNDLLFEQKKITGVLTEISRSNQDRILGYG